MLPSMQGCIVAQATWWGLGSQLVHLLHALAHRPAGAVFWDHRASPYTCCDACPNNGWDTLFAGDAPEQLPASSFLWHGGRAKACQAIDVGGLASLNRQLYNETAMCPQALCAPLRSLWVLSPSARRRADAELALLAPLRKPLVALHVRGGDKVYGPNNETRPYTFEAGLTALAADPRNLGGTCVVVGDDDSLGRALARAAPAALGCRVHYRIKRGGAHVQQAFNRQSLARRCEASSALLTDIETLAYADAAAMLAVSNTARVATLLRACRLGGDPRVVDWQGGNALSEACYPN